MRGTVAAVAFAALLPACGGGGCETAALKLEPAAVEQGGTLTVTADPPLKECTDPDTDVKIKPIQSDTITLAISEARETPDGTQQISGRKFSLKTLPFDSKTGEFEVTVELPRAITPGKWIVFVNGASEVRGVLEVKF